MPIEALTKAAKDKPVAQTQFPFQNVNYNRFFLVVYESIECSVRLQVSILGGLVSQLFVSKFWQS